MENFTNRTFYTSITPWKSKFKKIFFIIYSTLDGLSDTTTLYNECVDRSKLVEQKNKLRWQQ